MFRCKNYIKIEQQPSVDWPNRKTVLNFDFVTLFESSDSWRDLTNKGKLTLPKNLYFKDVDGKLKPLKGTNINVGGFSSSAPLFLRGDKVTITAGYKYFDKNRREIEDISPMFAGFITKVGSKIPIELELEDNMWLLKTTPVPIKVFNKTNTLEDILKFIVTYVNALKGTNFSIREIIKPGSAKTYFNQSFYTYGEMASQLLMRLQKTYGFEFYFSGNELRGGTLIYIEAEAAYLNFRFQENIISDELEYKRKDDIILSCKATNMITETQGVTKDGSIKTKLKRLEVLVTVKSNPKPGELEYTYVQIKRGDYIPENTSGERHDFKGLQGSTAAEIAAKAYEQLKKFYYTGLRGTFTTFGIPFIKQGDYAVIKNPKLPEQDGTYKIKAVDYSGGINGLRQVAHIDYKLPL